MEFLKSVRSFVFVQRKKLAVLALTAGAMYLSMTQYKDTAEIQSVVWLLKSLAALVGV